MIDIKIPESLRIEHDELHTELQRLMAEKGKVGEAAKAVAKIMHPHLVKEEIFALPPLGLMEQLTAGEWHRSMQDVLPLTDRLREEMHSMKEEHKSIIAALHALIGVARSEQKLEAARFAERLIMHAKMEEEILYPSSLLVGELVRARLTAELAAHAVAS